MLRLHRPVTPSGFPLLDVMEEEILVSCCGTLRDQVGIPSAGAHGSED